MIIKNPRAGKFLNWRHCHTGLPLLASWMRKAQQTFNHLRGWRAGNTYVASYIGRPDEAVNGDPSNRTVSTYYVITGFPVPNDAPPPNRKIRIRAREWKWGFGDPNPLLETWEWYADAADGAAQVTKIYTCTPETWTVNDDYTDAPGGPVRMFTGTVVPVATGTNDGFRMSLLTVENVMMADLSFWALPLSEDLTADNAIVTEADVTAGEPVLGYKIGGEDRSVGALAHYMDSGDSMIHATRRALIGHCYPIGAFAAGTGDWVALRAESLTGSLNASTYKVTPRNLDNGTGDITCDVALCVTMDVDTQIRLTAETSGDKWEYTSGGDAAALITTSDGTSASGGAGTGLQIDPAGDYIRVDVKGATESDEVLIHTISLWEPRSAR